MASRAVDGIMPDRLVLRGQAICLLQCFCRCAVAFAVGSSAERRCALHKVSYIHIDSSRRFGGTRQEESSSEAMRKLCKSLRRETSAGGGLGHGIDLALTNSQRGVATGLAPMPALPTHLNARSECRKNL